LGEEAQRRSAAGVLPAFITVTGLFFAWRGFITSNNDPLIATLRGIYCLTTAEAVLTQFAFFLAYGVFFLPATAGGDAKRALSISARSGKPLPHDDPICVVMESRTGLVRVHPRRSVWNPNTGLAA
jgi:hypothetical protein